MSLPRRLLAPAIALTLLAALPATAAATATVSLQDAGATVLVDDDALAINWISIGVTDGRVRVTEQNSTEGIAPGAGCEQDSAYVVSCPAAGVQRVTAWLGDGPDEFTADATIGDRRLELHGEGGNDQLSDGPAGDLLDGGSGWRDVLRPSGGDDEIDGGTDGDAVGETDFVSYAAYAGTRDVDVTLPAHGATSTGNGDTAAGENDTIKGVEDVRGGSGDDVLIGNERANALGGGPGEDDLRGHAGGDVLNGQSDPDELDGGPDYDRINTADYVVDHAIDCGSGSDDLNADNDFDPPSTGCEVIAPEFTALPVLTAPAFRAGSFVTLVLPEISGSGLSSTRAEWKSCAISCARAPAGDASGYRLSESEVGRSLYAHVIVENRAGSASATTDLSPKIAARPPAPPAETPPLETPPADPPPGPVVAPPVETPADRLARLTAAVGGGLRALARVHDGADPRRLARAGRARHRFAFPESGAVTLRWIARGSTIAAGRADGDATQRSTVAMTLSKRGRTMLRRSARLRVTLSATFVGGAATKSSPAVAEATFTLRRRPARRP